MQVKSDADFQVGFNRVYNSRLAASLSSIFRWALQLAGACTWHAPLACCHHELKTSMVAYWPLLPTVSCFGQPQPLFLHPKLFRCPIIIPHAHKLPDSRMRHIPQFLLQLHQLEGGW